MSDLPKGWTRVDFDGAVDVISDRGFRIKQKDYLPSGKLPVVDQGEGLIGGYTDDLDAQVTSPVPVIVFGDHTRRFKFVKFSFAVGADGVKLFSPTPIWNPEFLFLQLGTIDLENRGYGRHYQHLRKESLVLAPVAEQTRIVEKLEELLSDLDAGVAELKAAQKKLAQYRQSLLKAAVEGALTADWRTQHPPAETGEQLLQRILTERRARWEAKQLAKFQGQGKAPPKDWQKKYPEPVQPETSGLPALPQGWVWSAIGQCFHVAVGATPSRKEAGYWDGGIPWVSSGEVRFSRIAETKETITEEGLNNSSTQLNPPGSVMLGMIGEGKTRGQVAILDIEAANNQNCAAIWVPDTDLPPEFVYAWLWSRYEDTRRGSSGNNQPALNKSLVERMSLPLPPVAEAQEISRRLEAQLDGIAQQEAAIERLLKQSTAQRQNILRAAFTGQLVPQDPSDEPASVLLERIRAERAARETPKRPRGRPAKEAA